MTRSTSPAAETPALRRRAFAILFWFVAAALLFNALFGDMGLVQGLRQRHAAARLRAEIGALRAENAFLATEIQDLRHDPYRIETIAREELGLGRPGEIILVFKDEPPPAPSPGAPADRRVP